MMKRLLPSCLAISAIAFIAPSPASAAAFFINDVVTDPNIIFSMNDFEGGFFIDGVQRQIGLNNPQSFTVSEISATGSPIVHSFSGTWLTPGGLVPTSGVIAFAEGGVGEGISDILTFAYTNVVLAGFAAGHLEGTFVSDAEPGQLLLTIGATLVSEATPFVFNNSFITASAQSDAGVVPLPGALPLFATGLGALGLLGWRRKRKAQAAA